MEMNALQYQNKLSGLAKALAVARSVHPDMTVLQLRVLIHIAGQGQVSGTEVATSLDLHKAVVSRIIGILSDVRVSGRQAEGLGFVAINEDPLNRRVRLASITDKGHGFIQHLVECLE